MFSVGDKVVFTGWKPTENENPSEFFINYPTLTPGSVVEIINVHTAGVVHFPYTILWPRAGLVEDGDDPFTDDEVALRAEEVAPLVFAGPLEDFL